MHKTRLNAGMEGEVVDRNINSRLGDAFLFSQSSLQDFVDCPRLFQLRHLEHLPWPAIESEPLLEFERHQHEGQVFHRLAHQALIGLPLNKIAPLVNTADLQKWWDQFCQHVLQSLKMQADPTQVLYPEFTLSAPVRNHRLMAKFDLLVTAADRLTIFDWKTNLKRPKDDWSAARLQTRVYRYMVVAAGDLLHAGRDFDPGQVEMIYWFTNFPEQPAHFPYSSAQFQRDRSSIESLIMEIDSLCDFPRTEDEKRCRYCPYRSFCERSVKVGNWEETVMDDLALRADFDIDLEQIAEIEF